MAQESVIALIVFAAVMCFTPGPNNTMLLASGLNFGFLRTVQHVLGVGLGFALMALLTGLGIGQAVLANPALHGVLQVVSICYLLWLAWRLANSGAVKDNGGSARPMSFLEGALFQWVNPKGWIAALGASAAFVAPAEALRSALTVGGVFAVVGLASATTWALFGQTLQRLINRPSLVRGFNIAMALLLVASLWPIIAEAWPNIAFSP
jgi:threonine/homoserine/homoserine lactone efflux protein